MNIKKVSVNYNFDKSTNASFAYTHCVSEKLFFYSYGIL